MKYAIGLIEAIGLATAYEAADAAIKASNVWLLGLEPAKGDGMYTVKLLGAVDQVKAGVAAGAAACGKGRGCYSTSIIPHPHDQLEKMIHNEQTLGNHALKIQLPNIVKEDYKKYNVPSEKLE